MMTQVHESPTPAFRNPWVLGWIGLILVVLSVNLIMVYFAVSTSPGLVNANYYEQGQNFEKTLISRRMRDPEWTIRADVPADIAAGQPEWIRAFVVDKTGQPVDAKSVTLFAYRPSDAKQDFSLAMTREDKGRYAAKTGFPLMGVWDTLIAVKTADDEFTLGQRVSVRPQ